MQITHVNFAKGFRGGERQTQLLIEQLSKQGYIQNLLVRKNSQLIKRCEHLKNLQIIEISKPYIFSLNKLKGSTILHAHETKALQFVYAAHLVLNLPYIVTRRVDNALKNNLLNKKMYASSLATVALSTAIKNEILKVSPTATVTIIPSAYTNSAVNSTLSKAIKARFENKFLIGHVGALDDRHKGQSLLIATAKMLQETHPNIHFIFVGSGQDEAALKLLATGLENITFEGFVNNVNDYINAFDLFVFPSRNEGLGSILFDVMRLNVPIVASDVGGIPDIIQNGSNGILVPPLDVIAIKDAILELYDTPKKRHSLAEVAKDSVESFSPSKMLKRYLTLYKVSPNA